jgi:pterin-4a-carbinolamine dehydratase
MLTNFLKDLYKSKAVSKQLLENNLKNWNITKNKLTKTFEFYNFQQAMTFMNLAAGYVQENQIKANM